MKAVPEFHQQGIISIENIPDELVGLVKRLQMLGDFGVQVAADGRVWICINGIAFIRFSPHANGRMSKEES